MSETISQLELLKLQGKHIGSDLIKWGCNEIDRLRTEVAELRALIQRCVDDDIDSGCFRKATYEACVAALEAPAPPDREE